MTSVPLPTIFEVSAVSGDRALLTPLDDPGHETLKIDRPPVGLFVIGGLWEAYQDGERVGLRRFVKPQSQEGRP